MHLLSNAAYTVGLTGVIIAITSVVVRFRLRKDRDACNDPAPVVQRIRWWYRLEVVAIVVGVIGSISGDLLSC